MGISVLVCYVEQATDPGNAHFCGGLGCDCELGFEEMSFSFISKSDYTWNLFAMRWHAILFKYWVNAVEQMYL